jgi:hypothetical protein
MMPFEAASWSILALIFGARRWRRNASTVNCLHHVNPPTWYSIRLGMRIGRCILLIV